MLATHEWLLSLSRRPWNRARNIFLQTNFSPIDLKEEYLNAWLSSAAAKMPFRKLASAYRANASWPRFFPYSMLCNDPQALAMLVTHEKLKGIVTTFVFDHIEREPAEYE